MNLKMTSRARIILVLSVVLMLCSLLIRYKVWGWETSDMRDYMRWYDTLRGSGFRALVQEAGSYSPASLYLIALAAGLPFLAKRSAIKVVLLGFDLLSAFLVYRIAGLRFVGQRHISSAWAALYFTLPTVIVNSSGWGQMDTVYSTFLLACLFFLLAERPALAVLAFSLAFSFKAQAIFLLPFLAVLVLRRRIPWWYFGMVPVVYVLFSLPGMTDIKTWSGILGVYQSQATVYRSLSMNAPTLYFFFNDMDYETGLLIGLGIAALGLAAWVLASWRSKRPLEQRILCLLAALSVALTPFLLPKMHDRYFYPADVFSLVLVMFIPELWFVPLGYQLVSGLSYGVYLFDAPASFVKIAAILNTLLIGGLLWKWYREMRTPGTSDGLPGEQKPV
jgi:Gpi18-like mannosyltransferase